MTRNRKEYNTGFETETDGVFHWGEYKNLRLALQIFVNTFCLLEAFQTTTIAPSLLAIVTRFLLTTAIHDYNHRKRLNPTWTPTRLLASLY